MTLLDEWVEASGVPTMYPSPQAYERLADLVERDPLFDGVGFLDAVAGAVEEMVLLERFARSHPEPARYARIVGPGIPDVQRAIDGARVDLGRVPVEGLPDRIALEGPGTRHLLASASLHRLGYRAGIAGSDPSNPHLVYPIGDGHARLRLPLLFTFDPETLVRTRS